MQHMVRCSAVGRLSHSAHGVLHGECAARRCVVHGECGMLHTAWRRLHFAHGMLHGECGNVACGGNVGSCMVARGVLHGGWRRLYAACRRLHAAGCMLTAARCLLHAARRSLHVAPRTRSRACGRNGISLHEVVVHHAEHRDATRCTMRPLGGSARLNAVSMRLPHGKRTRCGDRRAHTHSYYTVAHPSGTLQHSKTGYSIGRNRCACAPAG